MRKLQLLLFVIYLPLSSIFAQNISAIEQWVQSAPDEYYSLLDRFEEGDPVLSLSDCEKLYYGFAFCTEYNGNIDLFSKMYDALKDEDTVRAYEEAVKCKEQNPVCLELLYQLASLAPTKKEGEDYAHRFIAMMRVILNSGDGKTPQSAFKVIRTGDEYKILAFIYKMDNLVMHVALDGNIDQMVIKTREGKEITVYFDCTLPSVRDAELLKGFHK